MAMKKRSSSCGDLQRVNGWWKLMGPTYESCFGAKRYSGVKGERGN